ncbi:tRNA pseudouridine38-40 synthase [Steroidobacter denitrificans]|uniref:tRNA pseudouridine synthase A n=1 Tax=Steroidobacter denitrificans TaxID=465721 RepID=A0A127FAP7_STEDE|nr:tRNA pseudouridine(38-40) synthase TruA [Steroidobacter denitrificans]AMN47494.1 tRNA pseudouridine38-40 synthase [Steroidobacter denitrificans]
MTRIALGLEYDGSAFAGWQSQAHALGVQSVVEAALSRIADHAVHVTAAGRTDAGVHAVCQVVHFDTTSSRSERGWVRGTTAYLPAQISVLWAREVPDAFHARYSAQARRYLYVILNRNARPALAAQRVCWVRDPLDTARMQAGARHLLGEHDFSSFRAAQCQSRTPLRRLYEIQVQRRGELVLLTVCANAFLHHMVRNIAGVLIAIGTGERSPEWAAEVLAARDRTRGGVTAVASGLYLAGVRYASALQLPSEPADILGGVAGSS